MRLVDGRMVRLVLPEERVFEDVAPRLVDVDGDGASEVVVVESSLERGARLAIYGPNGLKAATPFIGQPLRWLALVGAADLGGDGDVEIPFVDRPHLASECGATPTAPSARSRRLKDTRTTASATGDIAGGIRNCGTGPEMVLADAESKSVLAVRLNGRLGATTLRPIAQGEGFRHAMACR